MDTLEIVGGTPLRGEIEVSGAKNVAMKVILASLLTDEPLIIHNVPTIVSVLGTTKIVAPLGVEVQHNDHTLTLHAKQLTQHAVPLELGGLYRTAPMVMGPLLARLGKAVVPNPGGCRLGKRPIDRHIEALEQMGAQVTYKDGFFYAHGKLKPTTIRFPKNTHTGTETVLLAAVLTQGTTVIENAAEEPEVDDLIGLLVQMGADIQRNARRIVINGVEKLKGTEYRIMPDRNEVVTYAVAAIATGGDIRVKGTQKQHLTAFFKALEDAGAGFEDMGNETVRFYKRGPLQKTDVTTSQHPGFMTDWQAPWAVLMTQAQGSSTIHETVFESRFSYVSELKKMGAHIEFYQPSVKNPQDVYNFNLNDKSDVCQAIRITGPKKLHDGVVEITDLRAGATLVVAALAASGKSILHGVDHIDRGYEAFDTRLRQLNASIQRLKEDI